VKARKGWSDTPALKKGQRVRLIPGGPVYKVLRVNDCAAYVKLDSCNPVHRTVEHENKRTGEITTTEITSYGQPLAISPYSIVEQVLEG
jgi:hypothetical protein